MRVRERKSEKREGVLQLQNTHRNGKKPFCHSALHSNQHTTSASALYILDRKREREREIGGEVGSGRQMRRGNERLNKLYQWPLLMFSQSNNAG